MSFLNTHPEALSSAAGALQTIAGALNAQNAAAASPITGLAPAAADEVSALQATQFAAYGTLYQQISAQAAALQEMFIHTLRTSAESYGETETANSAAATTTAGLGTASSLANIDTGAIADPYGLGGIASNAAILGVMQSTNVGAGASAFTSLGTGFITNPSGVVHHVTGAVEGNLASTVTPAGSAAPLAGGAAGAGQANPVNKLAAPQSWATEAEPEAPASPLVEAETTPEPHGGTVLPAGAPAAALANRGGPGFGRPRYGVKHVVMPRKPIV